MIPRVIAIGGCGIRALTRRMESGFRNADIIAIDTDRKELTALKKGEKVSFCPEPKRGFHRPFPEDLCQKVEEEKEWLVDLMHGAETAILVSGMGGTTGTFISPLVAGIARGTALFTVAVVSMPFGFEDKRRRSKAEKGLEDLRKQVNSLIVIPVNSILPLMGVEVPLQEAFNTLDGILPHS